MNWVKVFNSMPTHPKILMAGDRAAWLFVCGCCYSNEHLTDGFIAGHVLPVAAPGVRGAEQLAARLVECGLWHVVDGGWQIHDYDEHQRTAVQIRVQRSKDAKRKADTRNMSARTPRGQNADSIPESAPESARNPNRVRDVEKRREEKKEKNNNNASLRSAVRECFAYWQERCDHPAAKLTADRRCKIEARLREGYSVADVRKGIDGAVVGAFVNDQGKRFDDIELICRNGSKLESFMARPSALRAVALERSPVLQRMDRWRDALEYRRGESA